MTKLILIIAAMFAALAFGFVATAQAEPLPNFFDRLDSLVNQVGNATFTDPDNGATSYEFHAVNPAPIVDTGTPIIIVSVESVPDTGCVNTRMVIDLDRECAIAVYCDKHGEGSASLSITGGCDN